MGHAEHLRRALALFGPDGERWIQCYRAKWDLTGAIIGVCSLGALSLAAPNKTTTLTAMAIVNEQVGAWYWLKRAVGGPVSPWNDAPGRTFPEIRDGFQRAIALAEGATNGPRT